MDIERSRRALLAGGLVLAFPLATRRGSLGRAEPRPEVTVYRSPT
jgi:hypothetical protein